MDETLFPLGPPGQIDPAGPQAPLAERMRPRDLEEVLGQEHLLGQDRFLQQAIETDTIPSMIFWGPPGVGKTTLARLIAGHTRSHFATLSAVLGGVRDVKRIVAQARQWRHTDSKRTILFVDEIHRFNKAQQDAFLPHVENGTLILIGATTENPSFEVIAPLLSRCRVLTLNPLRAEHLIRILKRALRDQRGLGGRGLSAPQQVLDQIAVFADGDARVALNALEAAAQLASRRRAPPKTITEEIAQEALQKKMLRYDKAGEEHFNLISALHKSLRNSDIDASLYWLGRMLEAGEDPLYLARRMVRFASEDVGAADPAALGYALDAMQAVHFIGLPEGKLALAQLAVYLAQAPKSNAVYAAYQEVEEAVQRTLNEPVPLQLRNAPTPLMKDLGYGRGYRYAHAEPEGTTAMECLPESQRGKRYYHPREVGFEKEIGERLKRWHRIRTRKKRQGEAEDTGRARQPDSEPSP